MKRFTAILRLIIALLVTIPVQVVTNAQTSEPTEASDCLTSSYVSFSPSGQYLAAFWSPHSIRIWDAKSGSVISTITDTDINFDQTFRFSPNEKYLVAGRRKLILWDILSGDKVHSFVSQKYSDDLITSMSFSPDGSSILVAYDHGYSVWNITSGVENTSYSIPGEMSEGSAFSPDGNLILTRNISEADGTNIHIWDVKSGKILHTFDLVNVNYSARFSPNGKYILIPMPENTILVDVKSFQTIHVLNSAYDWWIISPDGKYLMSATELNVVGVWDAETGELLHKFSTFTGRSLRPQFFNSTSIFLPTDTSEIPNHQTVASIFDVVTGREVKHITFDEAIQDIFPAILAPDRSYLVIYSDGMLRAWSIDNSKPIRSYC